MVILTNQHLCGLKTHKQLTQEGLFRRLVLEMPDAETRNFNSQGPREDNWFPVLPRHGLPTGARAEPREWQLPVAHTPEAGLQASTSSDVRTAVVLHLLQGAKRCLLPGTLLCDVPRALASGPASLAQGGAESWAPDRTSSLFPGGRLLPGPGL